MLYTYLIKVALLTTFSFVVAFLITPSFIKLLVKYKMGKQIRDLSANTPLFSAMHEKKRGTPTMGGIVIWGTVLLMIFLFYILQNLFPQQEIFSLLNFLSRSQTWLPLGAMMACALVGLVDDYFNVRKIGCKGGGLSIKQKLLLFSIIGLIGSLWFYYKLEWDIIHVPFLGNYNIGLWYIPLFIFIIFGTAFSVNEIDGLDGLAGGTLLYAFLAYGAISFIQGKYDLASLCGVIVGALLAFLWFNIHPARFFMGDTGALSLGVTLGIVVMLTNTIFLLPIIGLLFVVESSSVVIQLASKKLRQGKKVFLSSPIHHHLEASGWTEPQIVMRFWIIGCLCSIIGLIIALLDKF